MRLYNNTRGKVDYVCNQLVYLRFRKGNDELSRYGRYNSITEAHESQCVEFKEASFELPKDVWETYSAFANTEGGEIFLGISGDGKDQSFSITGVMDSQSIITAFWNKVRNPQEVSRDIMLKDGVYTIEKEGKEIVVISVSRAECGDKPVSVYDKKNKWVSWVRRGAGDYKASEQDITLMQYDGIPHADRKPLEGFLLMPLVRLLLNIIGIYLLQGSLKILGYPNRMKTFSILLVR